MTLVIRRRGAFSQNVYARFLCPEHGRFDALVVRIENGDPPPSHPCDQCGVASEQVVAAPMGRIKRGEVKRGKSDERPPGYLNTEPLADGVPYDAWSKSVDAAAFDARRKVARDKMGID